MNFLRVDMKRLTCRFEENKNYQGLAGRALTSQFIFNEVPANAHPLGKENKLIFAPGYLTGTAAPCTGRFSVGGKSPLTRGIKESNSGGTSGQKLARMGIDALVIEGMPEQKDALYILHTSGRGAELIGAHELRGLGNNDTVAQLTKTYGAAVGYMTLGQAGEMRLLTANIATTDPENRPTRGARRGGLGAVMGSKGLKAIVVDDQGCEETTIREKEQFTKYAKEAIKAIMDNPLTGEALRAMGTSVMTALVNSVGALPTQNFRAGTFEGAEKLSGETLLDVTTKRGEQGRENRRCCNGCPIACSRWWLNEKGERVGKRPEYEVIWSHGANLLIDDPDAIVEMNELEADFGIDGMDTGMALAVLMEAGIVEWGDARRCIEIVKEVGAGTYLGRIIGSGAEITGRIFGVNRVSCSKGQSLSAYDPRISKGMGVTYATSPMGSDNTSGFCFPQNCLSGEVPGDRPEGQAQLSFDAQVDTAAFDSVGLCALVGFHVSEGFPDYIVGMTNLKSGTSFGSLDELLKIGRDTLRTEFEFNRRSGISVSANRLPYFFYEEGIGEKGIRFDVPESDLDSLWEILSSGD